MEIRFAKFEELPQVNELRKQVNDLHSKGKPDVFKAGFNEDLRNYIYEVWNDPEQDIIVAVKEENVCGFALVHHIYKEENPYMKKRDFLDIDEFCVEKEYRRQGVGTELISFIKQYAKEKGYKRIELNMWEFNLEALDFYESVGFETYRRYMEFFV